MRLRAKKSTGLLALIFMVVFSITSPAGMITYTYDNAGRLTRADYGAGKTVEYAYDNNGNLLNRTVNTGAGGDTTGPSLAVTSHTDGQHVTTASITLAGTASDSGKGDSGIAQVTVNGSRADNDTAVGAGTANWSKTINLNAGANAITVVATDNSANQNQTTQTLNVVYDIPPTPATAQTNAASGVTSSGATLNGTVNANNNNTTVTFQYGLTTAYGSTVTANQSPVTGNSNTAVSKAITGLLPNTTYHFQVVGVNGVGTVNGGDLTFTTQAAAPTAQTNTATGVTNSGATLNGIINPNGLSTTYCFRWGLTTAYGNTSSLQGCGSGTNTVGVSANLSGLTPNATYHYCIMATNSLGTTYGADMTFNAASTTDQPSVNTGLATHITKDSATLNGMVNPNTLATIYYFEWGLTTGYGNTTSSQSAGSGSSDLTVSASLTGLIPQGTYHFRLVASNSLGTNYGPDRTFQAEDRVVSNLDFDGDVKADILWRQFMIGEVYLWLVNGPAITDQGSLGTVDLGWEIMGEGDFDGDGRADVLWRQATTGEVYIWLMNGLGLAGQGAVCTVDLDWEIKGIGDFDGDGKADILWRQTTTGVVYIWLMNGLSVTGQGAVCTVHLNWEIKGVGDFDGDGKADILWRHALTGEVYLWLMDGLALKSLGSLGTVAPGWKIMGVGDFNGDGKADILWRHSAGEVYLWEMNGLTSIAHSSLGQVNPIWEIKGIGDFNGDAKADILWRQALVGEVYIWLMDGPSPLSGASLGTVSLDWDIQ